MDRKMVWKIFDLITDPLAVVAGTLLLLITVSVSIAVILRYLHLKPPIWVLQFTEYALLWMTFLGAAWLLRQGGHIRIDTVVTHLSPKLQGIIDIIVSFLGFVVCVVIVWLGSYKTIDLVQRGVMDVKGVSVPKYALFVGIPLGGLMLLIQFGRNFVNHIKALRGGEERR